jgi:hypothetical protein
VCVRGAAWTAATAKAFFTAPLNNARYIIITSTQTHGWNMKEARFNIQMAVCVEYLLLTRLSEIAAFHSAIAR